MHRWVIVGLLGLLMLVPIFSAAAQENAICTLAFEDLNKNGIRDVDENALAGISVHLAVDTDLIIATHISTNSIEPHCFENLTPGVYNIYFAGSSNHRATTQNSAAMEITTGQRIRIEFGAVPQEAIVTAPDTAEITPASAAKPMDVPTRILLALGGTVVVIVFMFGLGAIIISVRY